MIGGYPRKEVLDAFNLEIDEKTGAIVPKKKKEEEPKKPTGYAGYA